MKVAIYKQDGSRQDSIELPKVFDTRIREDIVGKYFEADKFIQPYSTDPEAGMKQSASGKIRHKRHRWRSHYGRGISRVPRKTMWRRGTQFYWIGATHPGSRGGRRAHPPKGIGKEKKINKKEIKLAMNSALAATSDPAYIRKRYSSIDKIENMPYIILSLPKKSKDFVSAVKKILGDNSRIAIKNKTVRAGKGKMRGRKYKSTAGILVLTGAEEKAKFAGFDTKPLSEVSISDLYPLGRITLFTKKAIEELSKEESK